MKILFDTNVVLDVVLNRINFVNESASVVGYVEHKKIEGYLCATTITTLDYLISKAIGKNKSKAAITQILQLFKIAEVNTEVLELSLSSSFKDFEDAVQYYSGEVCGVGGLVTRNVKDYQYASLPIYTPLELLTILQSNT